MSVHGCQNAHVAMCTRLLFLCSKCLTCTLRLLRKTCSHMRSWRRRLVRAWCLEAFPCQTVPIIVVFIAQNILRLTRAVYYDWRVLHKCLGAGGWCTTLHTRRPQGPAGLADHQRFTCAICFRHRYRSISGRSVSSWPLWRSLIKYWAVLIFKAREVQCANYK